MKKSELGDGEPSPPPKVGGVYTGLRGGCESDPSGLHECGVEENHKLCVCANCGANWPNPEWHGAAQEVSPRMTANEAIDVLNARIPAKDKQIILETARESRGDTRELKAVLKKIVIEEITKSTGPTGGWLDSPKALSESIAYKMAMVG